MDDKSTPMVDLPTSTVYVQKVPRMLDNTPREEEFEIDHTLRGMFHYGKWRESFICAVYTILFPLAVLPGLAVIITGIWAVVQCTIFFSITTQASISVIIISVLVILVGVLVIAVVTGFALYVKFQKPHISIENPFYLHLSVPIVLLYILAVILTAVGIAAGAMIPSLPVSIGISANISLFTLTSQGARNAWDDTQNTLRCCGAVNFSDYEQVFNNYSVPVSCCDTTNPLVNETTCPDIVRDANVTTDLIYTEGCVPQLVSYFHYIHSVVAGVSIISGGIPALIAIIVGSYALSLIVCLDDINDSDDDSEWCCVDCYGVLPLNFGAILMFTSITIVGLILIFGTIAFSSVATWGLVQDLSFYYPITAPANTNVVIISVLLIIAGGLMIGVVICQIATFICCSMTKYSITVYYSVECLMCFLMIPLLIIFPLVVGCVATGMSGPTSMELNSTLHKYLNDQTVQETWNDLQENMECCGVDHFTDYETVFSNFSVPVSCCNTTNPLASECPDIVRNSQQMIDQTGLIYSEGCVSHLESFFNNMFTVIAEVTIAIASVQLAVVLMVLWWCSIAFIKMLKKNDDDD